ncbi:MAG TPA: GDSL-type esterase/lipase family protein [Saprospiraceae bacterium]|nr:GDSL-type esterase/lipase family protein [Saprospiraceae bacterium]
MRSSLLLSLPHSTRMRLIVCLSFLTLFIGQCQSQFRPPQVVITDKDTVNYDFFRQEDNQIDQASYLEPFFQKLYEQRIHGGQKISIVHIGDSHILGNFLTREVRARLQSEFGDAGRGLVFPYKLGGSNGPKDFLVETNARWIGSNCQRVLAAESPFGISGFSIQSTNLNAELTFRLRDTATSETRFFTKVTVFQHKTGYEYDVEVLDETSGQKAQLFVEDQFSQSYYFDRPVGQATVRTRKLTSQQKRITIDGVALENELSGVVYHSIGVNGAKYQDFVRAKYFSRQVSELAPDLIILSFGTNEAQGKADPDFLRRSMQNLIESLQENSPNALIMLTTPADSYLRSGRSFNPNMAEVSEIIRKFAREKGYALWDLHKLSGGENSAQNWKTNGLMSTDSVHYTKVGYAAQGKLLYQSLIKGYNNFASAKQ